MVVNWPGKKLSNRSKCQFILIILQVCIMGDSYGLRLKAVNLQNGKSQQGQVLKLTELFCSDEMLMV